MEPAPAELCCYCSRLIPPRKESSSERAHQPNVALFLRSGDGCVMCKVIQDHWSLGEARRRFPDVDEATYESIPVTVKLKDVQSQASGVSWAILHVEFHLLSHAFVYGNTFSITTCQFECRLSILKWVVLLFFNTMPQQHLLHTVLSGKLPPHQSKTRSPL